MAAMAEGATRGQAEVGEAEGETADRCGTGDVPPRHQLATSGSPHQHQLSSGGPLASSSSSAMVGQASTARRA